MNEIFSWIGSLAVALAVCLVIRTFLFTIITVKGTSMLETRQNGDRLYVSVLSARIQGYERGDIVICNYPGRTDHCVKRLIGLPGETVEIIGGAVYINGSVLEEDYLDYAASYSCPAVTLGEGEYFVMGDNRPVSHDSHSSDVGPVTDMVGKVRCIIWPLDRIGGVK